MITLWSRKHFIQYNSEFIVDVTADFEIRLQEVVVCFILYSLRNEDKVTFNLPKDCENKRMNWISVFVSYREISESLVHIPLFTSQHGNVHCASTRAKLLYDCNAEQFFVYAHFKLQNCTRKIMLFENDEKQERLGILQTEAHRIYLGFASLIDIGIHLL